MIMIAQYIHLLSICVWVGSMVFFSFIGAPAIFRTLDRKSAGDVVGVIFPKYYMTGYVCCTLALLSLGWMTAKTGLETPVMAGFALLLVMGGVTFYSGGPLHGKVTAVKRLIREEKDESRLVPLKKEFGKLHGISAVMNIFTLALGLGLVFMATRYMPLP